MEKGVSSYDALLSKPVALLLLRVAADFGLCLVASLLPVMLLLQMSQPHDANDVGCWEFRPCSSYQHNTRGTCGRAAVQLRGQGHARRSVAGEHKQRSLPSCSVSGEETLA